MREKHQKIGGGLGLGLLITREDRNKVGKKKNFFHSSRVLMLPLVIDTDIKRGLLYNFLFTLKLLPRKAAQGWRDESVFKESGYTVGEYQRWGRYPPAKYQIRSNVDGASQK